MTSEIMRGLWVMSDETLVAMYRDASQFANDETLNDPQGLQMRADAMSVAEQIQEQIRFRHSDWVLNPDGTFSPEKSGTA